MTSDSRPESSTVRSALGVVEHVQSLIEGDLTVADAIGNVIEYARDLRPHQVEDVRGFLDRQYAFSLPGTVELSTVPDETVPPDDPDVPPADWAGASDR